MFWRRRTADEGEPSATGALTTLRDSVEIVAIIAAGAWAFYTFVYENQIKPAYSKPEAQVLSTLTRLGDRAGLTAIRTHVEVRNIGSSDVWLYGFSETVTGSRVLRSERAQGRGAGDATFGVVQPYWNAGAKTKVFGLALLTKLADARAKSMFDLGPGQSISLDRIFYVPVDRFDELRTDVSMRFSAHPKTIPFRLETRDGMVHVTPRAATVEANDTDGIDEETATLSLWAR